MSENLYQHWLSNLQGCLQMSYCRAVVRLSGDHSWCVSRVRNLLADTDRDKQLWVSDSIKGSLSPRQARTQLGKEYSRIVFDCHESFEPDALGAISGTLCGGGILFMLTPPADSWPLLEHSRYLQMIKPLLDRHPALYCLQKGQPLPVVNAEAFIPYKPYPDTLYASDEQHRLVEQIETNVLGEQPRAMVLIANRGRGKSSALGLAAGALLGKSVENILLTAPRLSICEQIFFHGARRLKNADMQRGQLSVAGGSITFKAPDALLDELPAADLLIVDEAAAIPLSMLADMLTHYKAIIFSSTLYGYEGTGRGFVLKFRHLLDKLRPGWLRLSMETPVRWSESDPLESWIDDILCLQAELESVPDGEAIDRQQISVVQLDKAYLLENQQQRNALFALLVSAHYRTRPSDFQYLLDKSSIRIYVMFYHQQILAAAVVSHEGGFDDALAEAIYQGIRRPRGHLLPQTLSFHGGVKQAAHHIYGRIMRIAVHPELQSRGLGSLLLKSLIQQESAKVDMLGCSFAATDDLLRFWQHSGFELVRLGFTRDHVTASHSVVMLKVLNDRAEDVFRALRYRFRSGIPYWLDDVAGSIQGTLRQRLLAEAVVKNSEIDACDWQDIDSFAHGRRGFEACAPALFKFVDQYKNELAALDDLSLRLIEYRIIQRLAWDRVVDLLSLTGKAQGIERLREAVARLKARVSESK